MLNILPVEAGLGLQGRELILVLELKSAVPAAISFFEIAPETIRHWPTPTKRNWHIWEELAMC